MLREEMILCAHCYFDTAWHTFGQLIVFTRHYYERLQYPGTTQGVDYLSQFQFVYQSIHIEFVLSPNDSNDTFTRRKLFVFQVSICFNAWSMHWSVYRSFLFYTTPQPISLHIQLYSTKLCASSSSLAASIPFLNATRRTIRFLQMFRLCSLHYYSLLRVERIVCDVAVRNKFLATRKKKHQNWLEVPIKFQAQVEMCTNLLCVINCHWARNWRTSLCS